MQKRQDLYSSGLPLRSPEGPAPSPDPEPANKGRWVGHARGAGGQARARQERRRWVGRRGQVFIISQFLEEKHS